MLSYLHSFHAGNFADVLKHWLQITCIHYLQQKPAAITYIDTHAGSGRYDLHSEAAQKNQEYRSGIGKLLLILDDQPDPLPPLLAQALQPYLDLVQHNQPPSDIRFYPGSADIFAQLCRTQDRCQFIDAHPQAFSHLLKRYQRHKNIWVEQGDGYQQLRRFLPPKTKRALVMMDPPYENKADYQQTITSLTHAWQRFPQATYLLWFPLLNAERKIQLQHDLVHSGIRDVLWVEQGLSSVDDGLKQGGKGMQAAGMIVINPPWTLPQTLADTLPLLNDRLNPNQAYAHWQTLIAE